MIFRTVHGVIRQAAFRQYSACRIVTSFRLSKSSVNHSINKKYSKMSYQIEERGSPNTLDYKLYISKTYTWIIIKSRVWILNVVWFYFYFSLSRWNILIKDPLMIIFNLTSVCLYVNVDDNVSCLFCKWTKNMFLPMYQKKFLVLQFWWFWKTCRLPILI